MDPFRQPETLALENLASETLASDRRPAHARALAERFRDMLDTAQALIDAQRAIDLAGLDGVAGQVCAACLDLPAQHRAAMADALSVLLDRLDWLEAALRPAVP